MNYFNIHKIKTFNIFIVTALLIIVISIGVGGYYLWDQAYNKTSAKSEQETAMVQGTEGSNRKTEPVVTPTFLTPSSPTVSMAPSLAMTAQTKAVPKSQTNKTTHPSVNSGTSGTSIYSLTGAQVYLESRILSLVNTERRARGAGGLSFNAQLNQAADIRAGEEASASNPDHTRVNGSSFDTVFTAVGYTGQTAWAENLVWGNQPNFNYTATNLNTLASRMFTLWKNSSGHYANMINNSYNQTGIGVVLRVSGSQLYWTGIELFTKK